MVLDCDQEEMQRSPDVELFCGQFKRYSSESSVLVADCSFRARFKDRLVQLDVGMV